jgi:putative ABC transport system permease protein
MTNNFQRSTWFAWPTGLRLDATLALRLLARYPVLTIVGTVAMAFGLAAGVAVLEIRTQLTNPALPLVDGDRIIGLRLWDARRNRPGRVHAEDFRSWRERLRRVTDLGAASLVERNLIVDGQVDASAVAEMSASAFRVAKVAPLHGRTFLESDEQPGAAPVAIIGYALWQQRFLADPKIVGRVIQLGPEYRTIVGVMPDGFAFPVAHQLWTPLRADSSAHEADAPSLLVFGRLAPGIALGEAQAEFSVAGGAAGPGADLHASDRPEAVPYAHLTFDPRNYGLGATLANIFFVLLIVVIAANVALLTFARAASREREISVRNALGASRTRIVLQLFVEAMMLSGISVLVGLAGARYLLGSLWRLWGQEAGRALPFWLSDQLAPSTIGYGAGLAVLTAVIVGVFPALKITERDLHTRLRSTAVGGYRFGGVWTTVIIAQVAMTVMLPATAFFFHRWVVKGQTREVGVRAEQFITARLETDDAAQAPLNAIKSRLAEEPGVTGVAFADRLPGIRHPAARVEIEAEASRDAAGHEVRVASVDDGFFDALGVSVLIGRRFTSSDLRSEREIAIVNTSFVQQLLGDRNAVGQRIRFVAHEPKTSPGAWIEIVGVVPDLGVEGTNGIGLYRPLAAGSSPIHVVLHAPGREAHIARRLSQVVAAGDSNIRVHDVLSLDKVGADAWLESQYMSRALAALSSIVMLLSLIVVYAIMAFTVVQRTREIGTRMALGATRRHIVAAIIRRPLVQIAVGIVVGGALVVLISIGLFETVLTATETVLIALYAAVMLGVCLSACAVPARRALGLQPARVLRADG